MIEVTTIEGFKMLIDGQEISSVREDLDYYTLVDSGAKPSCRVMIKGDTEPAVLRCSYDEFNELKNNEDEFTP